ncbi:MAG: methionyl-tRNA formyltransferase [Actinomycetota bacterium]
MSILPIRILGDPVLREPTRRVERFDRSLRRLADDLFETMYDAPGVGLAATQVGLSSRFFVFDDGEDHRGFLANVELFDLSGEITRDEGCLSIPGPFHPTVRAAHAGIRGQDLKGRDVELVGEGLLARIFQHETDHLDGTLYLDRLDEDGRKEVLRQLRQIELRRAMQEHAGAESVGAAPAAASGGGILRAVNASGLRVAFFGNDRWSVPSLEALRRSSHKIVGVLTAAPRPAGRGSLLRTTPVSDAARAAGLSVSETERADTSAVTRTVRDAAPDVLVVVAYGELLPSDVLNLAPMGAVNLHFSLLPAFRGATPVQHALLEGLARTGVTTMLLDDGLDTGPVFDRRVEAIRPDDDAGSLGDRLARIGADLLVETLDGLAAGDLRPMAQDVGAATRAPKLGSKDRVLDWGRPAAELVNRVRALAPTPGATTTFRGRGLKVLRASAVDAHGEPGTVVDSEEFVVAAGRGALRLEEIAPEGRKRMQGRAFARGARPARDERLG